MSETNYATGRRKSSAQRWVQVAGSRHRCASMSRQDRRQTAESQGVLAMDREGNAWIHKRVDGQDESPSASQERSTATFIDSGGC